jgi:ribosomal protein S6E (S10)
LRIINFSGGDLIANGGEDIDGFPRIQAIAQHKRLKLLVSAGQVLITSTKPVVDDMERAITAFF